MEGPASNRNLSHGSYHYYAFALTVLLSAQATLLDLGGIRGCDANTDNCSVLRSCMAGIVEASKEVLISEVFFF